MSRPRQLSNIKVSVLYSEGYWYIILALLQIFNPVREVYLGQDFFDHLKNNFWGNVEGTQSVISQVMQSRAKCTLLLIVVHWLVKRWCYRPRRITKLFPNRRVIIFVFSNIIRNFIGQKFYSNQKVASNLTIFHVFLVHPIFQFDFSFCFFVEVKRVQVTRAY